MELLKLDFKRVILLLILLNCSNDVLPQKKGLILDAESLSPIPFVSIHTKGNNVRGTMGNADGEYNIDFRFDTVYFSHINYELHSLTRNTNCDTVLMIPIVHMMPDIVITAPSDKWIERFLKKFINDKSKNYQNDEQKLNYSYKIKSLSDSSGYAFSSIGYIISPNYSEKEGYKICPKSNVIKYKDNTAGTDFMQLRRSVYNNFIKDFDNNFVKKHNFYLTSYKDNTNENLLQFSFVSKKAGDNTGYIIIDTLKNAIIEFEQISGTDYNIESNTSSFARIVGAKKGFKYTVWKTIIRCNYSLIDNSYHLSECRYQFLRQNDFIKGKKKGVYFTNIESELTISKLNINDSKECEWIKLPNPYSIAIIVSKGTRLAEEALDRVPTLYELF